MVPALGGYLDPRSGSGMTRWWLSGMTEEVLIRFPIGVGNDNCVVGDDGRAGVRVVFAFGLLILIELNG